MHNMSQSYQPITFRFTNQMTACKYDGKSCVYYKWTSELRKIRVQSINIVSKDKGLESA